MLLFPSPPNHNDTTHITILSLYLKVLFCLGGNERLIGEWEQANCEFVMDENDKRRA